MKKFIAVIAKGTGKRVHSGKTIKLKGGFVDSLILLTGVEGTLGKKWYGQTNSVVTTGGEEVSEHWLKNIVEIPEGGKITLVRIKDKYRIANIIGGEYKDSETGRKITPAEGCVHTIEYSDERDITFAKEYQPVCAGCGVPSFELFENSSILNAYCTSCREHVHSCTHCNAEYHGDVNRGYCPTCDAQVNTCEVCGEVHFTEGVAGEDGTTHEVCGTCRATLDVCPICGKGIFGEGVFSNDSRSQFICYNCAPSYDKRYIMNYSHKPNPKFRKVADEKLFLGSELEIQTGSATEKAKKVFERYNDELSPDNKGFFYMKDDSSIGGGFEMVTHPFSFEWVQEHPEHIENMFKTFNGLNLRAGKEHGVRECGMHVHMSKNAFTDAQIMKMMFFVHNNRNIMHYISDRVERNGGYYQYSLENKSIKDFRKLSKSKRDGNGLGHGSALHFTDHTIELRVFNSTLQHKDYLKNIETCVALHQFVKEFSIKRMFSINFVKFVEKNELKYPNLNEHLKGFRDAHDIPTKLIESAMRSKMEKAMKATGDGEYFDLSL